MDVTSADVSVAETVSAGAADVGMSGNGGVAKQVLGERAERTRDALLEASRRLFLERGFQGTRINNITDACGISRGGFYTYFKDKREVFELLGVDVYHESHRVVSLWDSIPDPCAAPDIEGWVRAYFGYMDQHGAFALAASQSGPQDPEFKAASTRLQMRIVWRLGRALWSRQDEQSAAPDALGLSMIAMLDRAWFGCRIQNLPVDENEVVHEVALSIRLRLKPCILS